MPVLLGLDPSFFTLLTTAAPEPFNLTGRMEDEGFQGFEEAFIPVFFMDDLPTFKVHTKLEMASSPSMTQEQYEQNILSLG